jgi:beta-lactam-binding protein with PASTA domain
MRTIASGCKDTVSSKMDHTIQKKVIFKVISVSKKILAGYRMSVFLALLLLITACGGSTPAENPTPPPAETAQSAPDGSREQAASPRPPQTGVVVGLTPIAQTQPAQSATVTQTISAFDEVTGTSTPISIEDLELETPSPTASATPTASRTATPAPTEETTPTEEESETPTSPSTAETAPTLDPRPVVPNLVGLSEQNARNRLLQLDSSIEIRVEQSGQCTTDGVVISSFPAAGDPIDLGSEILLTVCTIVEPQPTPTPEPAPAVVMPYVIGLAEQAAREQIVQLGMGVQVEVTNQVGQCAQDGEVIGTSPAAGIPLAAGARVVLTVCILPTPVPATPTPLPIPTATPVPTGPQMPALVGMHPDEARKILQDMGFEPAFQQVSVECERQTVVGTSPLAGQPLGTGTTIMIDVCAPMPDD